MHVDHLGVDIFRFILLDIPIVYAATNEALERSDGVLEIGALEGLGRLANRALLGPE